MSTQSRKSVLLAGLGATISDSDRAELSIDPSTTPNLVAAEVEKAKAAGFDCGVFFVEPADPENALQELRRQLREHHWDGLVIGYAVRALKEHSKLFEDMVNLAVQVSPTTKFVFPLGREDIAAAIQRSFEEAK